MSRSGAIRIAMATLLVAAATFVVAAPEAGAADPTQLNFVVMPHPDDEFSQWGMVGASAADYKVFLFMTRGEASGFCEASGGIPSYQGPGSPGGNQPDLWEINPLGTGQYLWWGKWDQQCIDARVASTVHFLNDKAASDPSLPSGFYHQANYSQLCTTNTVAGLAPQRDDNGQAIVSRGADVYTSANGKGKAIFFHLGDGDLKKEEVRWAIECVKSKLGTLGIPSLPYSKTVGSFRNASYSNCRYYDHPDHAAVHAALWQWDMNVGPQHARTCSTDPDASVSRTISVSEHNHALEVYPSPEYRIGKLQRNYGWLTASHWTNEPQIVCNPNCFFGSQQSFWRRF